MTSFSSLPPPPEGQVKLSTAKGCNEEGKVRSIRAMLTWPDGEESVLLDFFFPFDVGSEEADAAHALVDDLCTAFMNLLADKVEH